MYLQKQKVHTYVNVIQKTRNKNNIHSNFTSLNFKQEKIGEKQSNCFH